MRFALLLSPAFLACVSPVHADVFLLSNVTGTETPTVASVLPGQGFSAAQETTLTTLKLPGLASQTSTVTFTYVAQAGGFNFSFGFFNRAAATADPAGNSALFAQQGLTAATAVFDERTGLTPGTKKSYTFAGGTELVFFLIPDESLAGFLAHPGDFFPPQTANDSRRAPLFSLSDANPGGFDQMLSFQNGAALLLGFEDLSRLGSSDRDFNDGIFRVDYTTPVTTRDVVPEPTSLAALLLGAAACWAKRRRG
ncbi:MAG: DUF4114 domain-containing protein [Gemmataceae bacterium]